jgi:transketolase
MPVGANTVPVRDLELADHELSLVANAMRGFCMAANKHPGGTLSCTDFVACLYFGGVARVSLAFREHPGRDKVVFSKGHTWAPQLFALWLHGYFDHVDFEKLLRFGEVGNPLPRLPIRDVSGGIEMSTGSLGQGLSFGAGLAVADRFLGEDAHTFVVLGDAECGEGQVWEAASSASRLGLRNLTVALDANGYGSIIATPREQWARKWPAFGFETVEVNGHDHKEILEALRYSRQGQSDRPRAIVLHTVKGYGLDPEIAGTDRLSGPVDKRYQPPLHEVEELVSSAREIVSRRYREGNGSKVAAPGGSAPGSSDGVPRRERDFAYVTVADFSSDAAGAKANTKRFVDALERTLTPDRGLFLLSPDAVRSSGLHGMRQKWGSWAWENHNSFVLECPIAEQDTGPLAAGIAASGMRSAVFLMEGFVWRMLDSIRESIAYPQLPVVIVATSAGLSDELGAMVQSDTCFLAVSSMLGLELFEACDTSEARVLFAEAVQLGKPAYLRIPHHDPIPVAATVRDVLARPGLDEGIWTLEDEGDPELVMVTAGALTPLCREVAADLRAEGVRVRLLSIFSLSRARRLSPARLRELIPSPVPTLSVYNGPPQTFSEFLTARSQAMGVTSFGISGQPVDRLYEAAGLSRPSVLEAARSLLRQR